MHSQRGVALILVMFIVALATILVVHLTSATYLSSRASQFVQGSIEAEYLLKTVVNYGRALLRHDNTLEDSSKDSWGKFMNGASVDGSLIGLPANSVRLHLQIRPVESKINVANICPSGGQPGALEKPWLEILRRLFEKLGFNLDAQEDETGLFPGRVFTGDEMISNLVDYIDGNPDSWQDPDFPQGIESDLPKDTFSKKEIKQLNELSLVPGFTRLRVQKLLPYITTLGKRKVNINVAPALVLTVLSQDMNESIAQQVLDFREATPFDGISRLTQMQQVFGPSIASEIDPLTDVGGDWFEIIGKAEYATASYFIRAIVEGDAPNFPEIESIELY